MQFGMENAMSRCYYFISSTSSLEPLSYSVTTCSDSEGRRKANRFYFQSAWLLHCFFNQWFMDNWCKEKMSLVEKTQSFTDKVKGWSSIIFGDLNKKKKRL